jgi:hypothetical protein
MPTFKAKENLEQLLGNRLWTDQKTFWNFRKHNYDNLDAAHLLYRIRPPSLPDLPVEENTVAFFTSTFITADVCTKENCHAFDLRNSKEEIYDHLYLPIRRQFDAKSSQLQNCL